MLALLISASIAAPVEGGVQVAIGQGGFGLARDFALTNKDLEVQLLEVQRLSEIALAQERRARQEEVERQLLEAENQRKSRELEETFSAWIARTFSPD